MANIIGMVSFYLKEGVSEQDFLTKHEEYNREFVSAQKGYLSHQLLLEGDRWSDLVTFESMEDMQQMFEATQEYPIAAKIMTLIDQIGNDEDIPLYTVVKNY